MAHRHQDQDSGLVGSYSRMEGVLLWTLNFRPPIEYIGGCKEEMSGITEKMEVLIEDNILPKENS